MLSLASGRKLLLNNFSDALARCGKMRTEKENFRYRFSSNPIFHSRTTQLSIRLLFRFGWQIEFQIRRWLVASPTRAERFRDWFAISHSWHCSFVYIFDEASYSGTPTRTSHGDKINIYKIFKHSAPDGNVAIMDCCESSDCRAWVCEMRSRHCLARWIQIES